MADNDPNTRRRVKLYMLNEHRAWDDQGTGHVSSVYVEKFKGMSLLVRSETDGKILSTTENSLLPDHIVDTEEHQFDKITGAILLESKIQPHTAYQKQQDTLIVWSEAENCDYALSFQTKEGCDEIWEKICSVQGKDPSVECTQEIMEPETEDMDEERFDESDIIDLPPCELSKLNEISELFNSVLLSPVKREKLAAVMEQDNYIKQLLDLFHMCEDLENDEGLHHLFEIFKSVFLLNRNSLFEIMFSDELIFDVVGVLEYDPSLPQPAKHREFLRTQAHFKEVIPITNHELIQKIHQTYRVQYIQDVISPAPSVFEENMLSTLTSFVFFNKVEIVSMIQEDEKFLPQLFMLLTDDETDDERRRNCVLFLKEFCHFSQTLQVNARECFFKTLSNFGILGALEVILGLDDDQMKTAAIDIFSYIVEFSPSMVRDFVLSEAQKQEDEDLLINLVIEQMVTDSDEELGGAVQLMGIIRLLIDPDNMLGTASKTEKSEFLSFFYKHCMHVLTAPLFANTVGEKPSQDNYQTAQLLSLILELLTFCIEHHTFHMRNYVQNKDLIRRVLVLLNSRHAFLALGALRMLRRTIGLKDDVYVRYIIRGDLFQQVVDAFLDNGTKYNLLNSAMIELFEFIWAEDLKLLTSYVVDKHIKAFENVDYVKTFKNLKLRYEQHQDRLKDKPTSLDSMQSLMRNSRFRRDARTLDEEEEIWFDQEEDYDEPETLVPMTDMLKHKLDSDLDQISRFLERTRSTVKEPDVKESPPRLFNRTANSINFNLARSPPSNMPSPTPTSSPVNSPSSPMIKATSPPSEDQVSVQTKKPGLVGLVDYPDEDSDDDEEDEEEGSLPLSKRPRLST